MVLKKARCYSLYFLEVDSSPPTFQFLRAKCRCTVLVLIASFHHGFNRGEGLCAGTNLSTAPFSREVNSIVALSMFWSFRFLIQLFHSSGCCSLLFFRCSWNPFQSAFCQLYFCTVPVGMNSRFFDRISNLSISLSYLVPGPSSTAQFLTAAVMSLVVTVWSMTKDPFPDL